MSPKLSICIPTYKRTHCLEECLNSIKIAKNNSSLKIEVCISDNDPEGSAGQIIKKYESAIPIKYNQNKENIGLGYNILKSSMMASGEFSWIIGNDDLLLPNTFNILEDNFNRFNDIDYYFVNSYHMNSKLIFQERKKFNFNEIINLNLSKFSKIKQSKKTTFFELINKDIAFDFLLGMFLSIYKTNIWMENINIINISNISDKNLYSNFDNTCPHVKIFGHAFKHANCYFQAEPLSINLFGEREWNDIYPFIESFRIPQVLDYYRDNGLNFFQYLICKNFALRKLFINYLKIIFLRKYTGLKLISFRRDIFCNLFYPYVYLGPIFYVLRKIFKNLYK